MATGLLMQTGGVGLLVDFGYRAWSVIIVHFKETCANDTGRDYSA
jgi:hypothetical protein